MVCFLISNPDILDYLPEIRFTDVSRPKPSHLLDTSSKQKIQVLHHPVCIKTGPGYDNISFGFCTLISL